MARMRFLAALLQLSLFFLSRTPKNLCDEDYAFLAAIVEELDFGFDEQNHAGQLIAQPTHLHIRFGRGTCNNNHPGNKIYVEIVRLFQPWYKKALTVRAKKDIIKDIIDLLEALGMSFVNLNEERTQWSVVEMTDKRIHNKIGQSLRDDHTKQGMKAKRVKYPNKRNVQR